MHARFKIHFQLQLSSSFTTRTSVQSTIAPIRLELVDGSQQKPDDSRVD